MRAASASASPSGTQRSAPISSGTPPLRVAATGSPAPIASSTENGENSWLRELSTSPAAPRSSAGISARATGPISRTGARVRATSSASSGRAGPSPAIQSGTPAIRAASIATSSPFSGERRPAASR